MESSPAEGNWVLSEDGGHRLRTWTPSELALRETGLLELAEVLEQSKIPYFLADGTLLGAARDGDFIPWDPDVGIWIKEEVFSIKKQGLIKALTSRGFAIDEVGGRNPKLNAYKYSEKFELESWRLLGSHRARGGYRIPAHLLDNPGQIRLRGRLYPCPSPTEDFLAHRFGEEWRTPKVLWERSHASSKTPWALMKSKLRQLSPPWLIHLLGRA